MTDINLRTFNTEVDGIEYRVVEKEAFNAILNLLEQVGYNIRTFEVLEDEE